MSERDVVITGLGMVSPLGKNVSENRDSVRSMKTGIVHEPKEGLPDFFQYAGKVSDYQLPDDIPPKLMGQMKFLNRGALLGFCAACEAVSQSRESILDAEPGRRALYVASGDQTKIGFDFIYPAIMDALDKDHDSIDYPRLNESALNKVNPFFLLESLNNNLFSFLSAYGEFMGPNTSLASLSPYGGNAMELAYRSIRQNRADVALAVGYGSWVNELSLYELDGLGILSQCKYGTESYRPFDRKRDGFIPGEGGSAILLESGERARQRGSTVFGTVREFANSIEFCANDTLSVADKVIRDNVQDVMDAASCTVDKLAFIILHGSGTRKGDRSELNSMTDIFNRHGSDSPICGLKPYTGHMGAASDIAEIIIGIHAVKEHMVPATLNFTEADKPFSGLKISAAPRECDNSLFLSVNYGVGGQTSSVIIDAE